MACNALSLCIDSEMECRRKEDLGSLTLQRLAEQLQCYNPPSLIEELENFNNHRMGSNFGNMDTLQAENEQFTCVNGRDRKAAVLICLFEGYQSELRVILTKRSMKLSSHPGTKNFDFLLTKKELHSRIYGCLKHFSFKEIGDVALPGGKMEEGDVDDSATALREAMEEIGLNSHLVQVVATLEPFISKNQLSVVPVIGLLSKIEDFRPVLNPDEVDAVFDVPLEIFLKEENHRCEERQWNNSWKYAFHCFDFETVQGAFTISGLTASILIRAASVIYQRIPCFTGDPPDFQQLQRALSSSA